jgi:hypothetical protein
MEQTLGEWRVDATPALDPTLPQAHLCQRSQETR